MTFLKTSLVTLAAFLFLTEAKAQDESAYKNIIKLNALGLPIATASVQYERAAGDKLSLAISVNAKPRGPLPFRGFFENFIDAADSISNAVLNDSRVSHFAITPEIRYYFGRGSQQGFYIGGYLRYAMSDLRLKYVYESDGDVYPIGLDVRGNSIGVGALIGVQFNLSERVALDWWIAGASINNTKISVEGTADLTDVDQEDRDRAEEVLEGEDIYNGAFDVTVTDGGGSAKGTLFLPGFRTGLCIGLRF